MPNRVRAEAKTKRSAAYAADASASWLSKNVLVVAGALGPVRAVRTVRVDGAGRCKATTVRQMAYAGRAGQETLVLAAVPAEPAPAAGDEAMVAVVEDGITASAVELTDVQPLVRTYLAPLDAQTRADVVSFLASAAREPGAGASLARTLNGIRDALRERLPAVVIERDHPQALAVDALCAVDDTSFYVKGWLRDTDAALMRLTAVAPEGARTDLSSSLYWYPRPDVDQFFDGAQDEPAAPCGFAAFFELESPSRLGTGWVFEVENADGVTGETDGPPVLQRPRAVRDSIIADLAHEHFAKHELLLRHISPAIERLQRRLQESLRVDAVVEYGVAPRAPDISIVVPLYGRIDLLEVQLATLADDPDIARCELVYVLDSPDLEPGLRQLAPQLVPIYRVPFRVVFLDRNIGFAGANNAGASVAKGRLLVLLNSDVVPTAPGWLAQLQAFYDGTPDIGALGPKLLFEDDSLQHAGMHFVQPAGSPVWQNAHYYKGLHRTLPAANVPRCVPAVTAACLMIDRALYTACGGLSGSYVKGDYEDSDLCLRLLAAGRENWYLPSVELYHLEGQSYDAGTRAVHSRYNAWLHTQRWRDQIVAIAADPAYATAT